MENILGRQRAGGNYGDGQLRRARCQESKGRDDLFRLADELLSKPLPSTAQNHGFLKNSWPLACLGAAARARTGRTCGWLHHQGGTCMWLRVENIRLTHHPLATFRHMFFVSRGSPNLALACSRRLGRSFRTHAPPSRILPTLQLTEPRTQNNGTLNDTTPSWLRLSWCPISYDLCAEA